MFDKLDDMLIHYEELMLMLGGKGECLPYGMITLEMGLLSRTFIIVRILLCRH